MALVYFLDSGSRKCCPSTSGCHAGSLQLSDSRSSRWWKEARHEAGPGSAANRHAAIGLLEPRAGHGYPVEGRGLHHGLAVGGSLWTQIVHRDEEDIRLCGCSRSGRGRLGDAADAQQENPEGVAERKRGSSRHAGLLGVSPVTQPGHSAGNIRPASPRQAGHAPKLFCPQNTLEFCFMHKTVSRFRMQNDASEMRSHAYLDQYSGVLLLYLPRSGLRRGAGVIPHRKDFHEMHPQ